MFFLYEEVLKKDITGISTSYGRNPLIKERP